MVHLLYLGVSCGVVVYIYKLPISGVVVCAEMSCTADRVTADICSGLQGGP